MSTEPVQKQNEQAADSSSSSSLNSTSNSVSLIKLDELSSFGATKQARLPALIKLNPLADQNSRAEAQHQEASQTSNSMPDFSSAQLEKSSATSSGANQQSLPVTLQQTPSADKENEAGATGPTERTDNSIEGFQVLDMEAQLVGPSLPAPTEGNLTSPGQDQSVPPAGDQLSEWSKPQQYASHLGDSLIEMIINLRNENQNLVKALEVNNNYVKERLDEFKRCQEEAKKREFEHQEEKGELEHQLRKVQRQNGVLSERLKSMESKLKEMKLEVSGTLSAAHSSKASSVQGEQANSNLYPQLADSESFSNANQPETTTMQIDATNGELYNEGDNQQQSSSTPAPAAPMDTDTDPKTIDAQEVGAMNRDQLSKRFDAQKADFYTLDDPMKQCDQLEQQLNDIGKRDYEICLLQQQLNIYRRDFRLERMAKLEAKLQIEKLKSEIDRLCLERLSQQQGSANPTDDDDTNQLRAGPAGDNLIGKLGHQLSRRALKSAAKAAKYASKQAHLEEKAAAALARAAAAKASAATFMQPQAGGSQSETRPHEAPEHPGRRHHHRGHHHLHHHHAPPHPAHHKPTGRSIRGEIVNDLMSTANKAMLTGYNLASTTINSALDKLSQFEQQQAAQATEANKPRPGASYPNPEAAKQRQQAAKPSAPLMDSHLDVD